MDIIEQNSVRKAYQKALLCLHPDKLQQRGALPHQKYTAEKVFDILQVNMICISIVWSIYFSVCAPQHFDIKFNILSN